DSLDCRLQPIVVLRPSRSSNCYNDGQDPPAHCCSVISQPSTKEPPMARTPTNSTPNPDSRAPGAEAPVTVTRRLLIVEDNEATRKQLQQLLQADFGINVDTARDGTEALEVLIERSYSIVLTDLKMPRVDGMHLIEEVQRRRLPVTVIVTTGHGSIHEAVQAMRLGAYDFLTKPIDLQHLQVVVERALRERTLQDEVAFLREQLQSRFSFQDIISKNPRMHAVFELINNVAQTSSTVLIEG